jgi:4-amino-4-deoxy-L-arabinose transferase-like glycosyltransferase
MPLASQTYMETAPSNTGTEGSGGAGSPLLEKAIPFLIFLSCLAYLCVFLRYSSLEPDEGIVLQGAERILHGELPYRDFFSFYTPGSFYFVAFLFRLFGDSFLVARMSIAITAALCSVITYLLARRVCSRGIAVFVALLATMAGAAFRFLVLHNHYSTLLCCLSLYAAVRFLETQHSSWAFAFGSLSSLTFLFEQSKGAGLCVGLVLGFLILAAGGRVRLIGKWHAISVGPGFVWPLAVTFAYFALQHSVTLMLQDWLWPLRHYTQANHVAYGFQNWSDRSRDVIFHTGPLWVRGMKILAVSPGLLVSLLPLISTGLLICWIARIWRRNEIHPESLYYILVASALLGLLASVVIVRSDVLHFMYLVPLWYVVLAWILGSRDFRSHALLVARPYLILYSVVAFGLVGLALLFSTTGARNRVQTRRGPITTNASDTVIDYVQVHVAPGERLLVYPYLPLYNYLTATSSPAQLDYFQPGMNTPEQAREIVAALKAENESAVLFEPWFSEKIANSWPETPLNAIANDPVADYIVRNYHICKMLNSPDLWRFHYMVRKEEVCP